MATKALALHQTTVGKKAIMAVTGFIMVGFVIAHMLGNMQVYSANPAAALKAYALLLRSFGGGLWVARLVLLGAVVLHAWAAISLVKQNAAARASRYHVKHDAVTSYAAKTMKYGGFVLLFFILYHLAHLTLHIPVGAPAVADEFAVFERMKAGFEVPWISALYILGNIALAMHLYHGVWSMLQSVGLNHRKYNALRKQAAVAVALVVGVGNISIPVAFMAGIVG
ncbi:MAG: succinate dehydrogenase cytochrome b subunit [Myxococcales bacterium]|nr:succinate dehydrogenase cytochrome b subunit [Myxococcales bacterium]MCB9523513.1 succinate dehydrogenase cytochrome b subunit [Myxococcales bacterium]